MFRPLVGLLGVLSALFPERILALFEGVAIENADDAAIEQWLSNGIRIEGVVVTLASVVGGRAYAWMMNLTGAFGVLLLLAPRLYRAFATRVLYDSPSDVEWNDRVTTGLRVIGFGYLAMAVVEYAKRRGED